MTLPRTLVVMGVLWLAAAGSAHAQVFSPGPLTKGHAGLEGIGECTQCHAEGGKHDNAKCNTCHKEIARRQDRGEGYHANVKARLCADCHREHRGGASSTLIEWTPSKRAFNHNQTGWPLQGAHKKPECVKCHAEKRIVDEAVRELVSKKNRSDTLLGLSSSCVGCHFDEHRDQVGNKCDKCHTPEQAFDKAPKFQHAAPFTEFILKGQHKTVACEKCHEDDHADPGYNAGADPKPRASTFMWFKVPGAKQNSCTACHDDVHRGQFGKNCSKCHTEQGWKIIKQTAEDSGFHDKTDFPLRGEHTSVACKTCHGPFPGQRAIFKGLKHGRCADCHTDAHVGQVAIEEGSVRCEKCHTVGGFVPVLFDAKMHDTSRFALDGSHEAVACNLCHKDDSRLARKVPAAVKRDLDRKKRRLLVSDAKLAMPDVVAATVETGVRCEGCHDDPHGGQFGERIKAKGCNGCHAATAFVPATFNHDDSRFPLTGKHKDVFCAGCHEATPGARGKLKGVVTYRPLEIACAGCHADQHVGQLASGGAAADCATCHETKSFKPARFDHAKQSRFPLEGKHATVRCAACHPNIDVGGLITARYKPLPVTCVGCHDDEHKGAFDAFAPPGGTK